MTATPHPAFPDAYLTAGWQLCAIPPGTKGPNQQGWNLPENALKSAAELAPGWGVGLLHSLSGTMAFDLDNGAATRDWFKERGIDIREWFTAPDSVGIDSGNVGHAKLLFTIPAFIGPLPTKKVLAGGKTIFELRCATADGKSMQDVLPPSRHPTSGKNYAWTGNGSWERLPVIPQELLAIWQELLAVKHEPTTTADPDRPLDMREVRSALDAIPASVGHDEWLTVLMALHSTGHEDAYDLGREWSMSCAEKWCGDRIFSSRWRSFKSDRDEAITIGSLFHLAREHGWIKPPLNVTHLFNVPPEGMADLLSGMVVRPPGADLSIFPAVLHDYAQEVSESVGCDPMVPVSAGLAAICAAIDSRSRLELTNGYKVPPVLWLMTIGSPADKKSPGSKPMFEVLADIERDDRARYQLDLNRWEAEEAAHAAAKKDFLARAGDAEYMMASLGGDPLASLPTMPILRPAPVPKRLVISDSTSQKMVRIAAERPEGLLCYLDEANGFFNKMTNPTSGDDRSAWVVSYESSRYFMDRVNAGSIVAENLAVSFYCNVQPQVFRKVLPNLSADGFVQRFIPITLRPSQTRLGNPVPAWSSCKPTWDHLVRQIHAAGERHYTLSESAYSEFRAFQQWYEASKRDERLIRSPVEFMTAFGKLEGLTGRLALVLHMIEDRDSTQVSADIMRRVIALVRGFVIPSFRYCYADIGGLAEESHEYWITAHILQIANEGTVTLSDIKRSGRRQWGDMRPFEVEQLIRDTMVELEQRQWTAMVEDGKKSTAWAINPMLVEHFREQRERIIAIKQEIKDGIRESHLAKGGEITREDVWRARGAA
jgi:hypothetical protein